MYLQKDDLTYIQNKSLFVDAIIRQQNLRPACKESDMFARHVKIREDY